MEMIDCPKCGKLQIAENKECVQCGIIFSKIKLPGPAPDPLPVEIKKTVKREKKKVKIICKKCGYESTDWACPKCFTINKSIPLFIYLLIASIIGGGYAFLKPEESPEKSTVIKTTHIETKKDKIEKYFDGWDGSHIELTKIIKASMNDPDSYKHVETKYGDKGDYIIVSTTFRGKNAFGGVITNWIMAKCSLDGKVQEIIAQGP